MNEPQVYLQPAGLPKRSNSCGGPSRLDAVAGVRLFPILRMARPARALERLHRVSRSRLVLVTGSAQQPLEGPERFLRETDRTSAPRAVQNARSG